MTGLKNDWTMEQKIAYREWADHYESYQKWLKTDPGKHALFDQSVRCIGRHYTVEYYRGFIEAISKCIVVFYKYFVEKQQTEKQFVCEAFETFVITVCRFAAHRIILDPENARHCSNTQWTEFSTEAEQTMEQDRKLLDCAREFVPAEKSVQFLCGFSDGFRQFGRLSLGLVKQTTLKKEPLALLKTVLYLQSGFCIGLMIENWPRERRPQ